MGDRIRLSIDLPAAPANAEKIQLMAAITEDGLSSVVTRGENDGRTLHHVAVARALQGSIHWARRGSVVRQLPLGKGWGPVGLKAVVWLRAEVPTGLGAAAARSRDNP